MLADQAKVTIVGVDGSRWVVHGPGSTRSPVRLLEGNLGDILDAPVTTTYKRRAGQAGTTFRGVSVQERIMVFPMLIFGDDMVELSRVDSDFRRALSYEDEFHVEVETAISGTRRLAVRLQESPELKNVFDPHETGHYDYTFTLLAADPYWTGIEHTSEFVFDGLNWYGDTVTFRNHGDVHLWPKWVLTAPAKFILPDPNFKKGELDKKIVLPFQPLGRDVLVDTDPLEELITSSDDTLLWAEMGGQFFENPVPPHTMPTEVEVAVDPLPNLPVVLPDGWKEYIAQEINRWAKALGQEELFQRTPEDVATEIRDIVRGSPPDFLKPLSDAILDVLNFDFIVDRFVEAWGSLNNMAGATAQVRLQERWSRPWGGE